MITRIVCMTFDPSKLNDFLAVFEANKMRIAGFEGCLQLELHQDTANTAMVFTISRWRSENDLENYRQSTLFRETWKQTKQLFAAPPKAWTLNDIFDSAKR